MSNQEPRPLDEISKERPALEVRVYGGSGAPASRGSTTGRLKMGVQISAGRFSSHETAVDPDEEVHRLVVTDDDEPARIRATEEVGPAEPMPERRSSRKKRWSQQRIMTVVSVSFVVLVILPMVLVKAFEKPERFKDTVAPMVLEGKPLDDSELSQFIEQAGKVAAASVETLERYAAAKDYREALKWVRDPERVEERMKDFWTPWGAEPVMDNATEMQTGMSDEGGRAHVILAGRKGNFAPFAMAFVREKGAMKLDWEASFGIGDLPISRLPGVAGTRSLEVRARVHPESYYTLTFPETDYRCYQLLDESGQSFVWGYVKKGSEVARQLSSEMDEESFLVSPAMQDELTLRISRISGAGKNEFQITEMIHKGWVSP